MPETDRMEGAPPVGSSTNRARRSRSSKRADGPQRLAGVKTASILDLLLGQLPQLRTQSYFKASLTALSHAIEDLVLAGPGDRPLVIASFQRERFYRQEARRYHRIAHQSDRVYVLSAPEAEFRSASGEYETVAFEPTDALANEWHLVVLGDRYAACLICAERQGGESQADRAGSFGADDRVRRFEGVWTFDRQATQMAASLLLERIRTYRPELGDKIDRTLAEFSDGGGPTLPEIDPEPFAHRLVTYLQAGQYKLLKAYRSISTQERKERLVNLITSAIRQSLDPSEVMGVAVRQLGQALRSCRCIAYRCKDGDATATVQYEMLGAAVPSLLGQSWPLISQDCFQSALQNHGGVCVLDLNEEPQPGLVQAIAEQYAIASWSIVPVCYRDKLLGAIELHHCGSLPRLWSADETGLMDAVATQLGAALMQAQTYADLEDLNQQLEALDRTRSNLIAITGHELRTPLSTIQVCLESLASEPDMPLELRQVMLDTALGDAERMRVLVQDFLTLSHLESGRVNWNLEPLPLTECVELALSSVRARVPRDRLPHIASQVSEALPPVRADGEWLVEVLSKLLDNACKFTQPEGAVTIEAGPTPDGAIEVVITDTGRGIEPNRLETVFDRFYQEEGSLRRTVGGTGLGLAICRQIILGLGGQIWAESDGKDRGSQFHFTIPVFEGDRPSSLSDLIG